MKWKKLQLVFVGLLVLGVIAYSIAAGPGRPYLRQVKIGLKHHQFVKKLPTPTILSEHMIEMPDGVLLATDVYHPEGGTAQKPVVLVRLPYGKRFYGEALHWVRLFTADDYVVVVQDMRGRHRSQGVFEPYPNEGSDGAATLDWVVAQQWSNDRVGTIGCSALGEAQLFLAAENHPAHKAMIPIGAGGAIGTLNDAYGFFGFYSGGVPMLASSFGWFQAYGGKTGNNMDIPSVDYSKALKTLPLIEAVSGYRKDKTDFEDLLDGFGNPLRHQDWGYISDKDQLAVPSLMVDTWYDYGVGYSVQLNQKIADSGVPNHLLIAPGTHCDTGGPFAYGFVGDVPVAQNGSLDFDQIYLNFMNHHLRGDKNFELPAFQAYLLKEDRWLKTEQWPPASAEEQTFYLDGTALLAAKHDGESQRSFLSDPMSPVPTLGGAICCTGDPQSRSGPLHQNGIEGRDDLLVYTSDPLQNVLRIVGSVSAKMFVSTDVPDTDIVVRLTDVAPDGTSTMIQEGALRLRYRDGFANPVMMDSGVIYEFEVKLRDIAYSIAQGHRLRAHIAGSSFPGLARNLNGGGDPNRETEPFIANIRVHSGQEQPSSITVFTLPE